MGMEDTQRDGAGTLRSPVLVPFAFYRPDKAEVCSQQSNMASAGPSLGPHSHQQHLTCAYGRESDRGGMDV